MTRVDFPGNNKGTLEYLLECFAPLEHTLKHVIIDQFSLPIRQYHTHRVARLAVKIMFIDQKRAIKRIANDSASYLGPWGLRVIYDDLEDKTVNI